MRFMSAVLAVVLAVPALASAQANDLGSDLSGYLRFVVYPHLQKGWESMQRGEHERALAELEQARRLAPESSSVSLHLAAAYRKFGDTARAESVLREQLMRTPDDARVRTALADVDAAVHAASRSRATFCSQSTGASCTDPKLSDSQRSDAPSRRGLEATAAARPSPQTDKTGFASTTPASLPRSQRVRVDHIRQQTPGGVAQPNRPPDLRAALNVALQARDFDAAGHQADALLASDPGSAGLFDEVTYKLVESGATAEATRLLFREYPFAAMGPSDRDTLFQRLILLIDQQRDTLRDDELLPLRTPLDTPALRSRQAAFWASRNDCAAVRTTLADASPEYGYDDWMRLGDCAAGDDPGSARQAYARAHALQAGARGSRALAYSAYTNGDYRTALDAWRTVPDDHLSGDDLIAAATTALAAEESPQASTWLTQYRERGETLGDRYWSLLGQSYGDTNAAAAIAAFEHAVELRPNVDDYLRLALLVYAPNRQVQWLERAVDLDRDNAMLQLQLAYAYMHAERPASALAALERAAAIDPANMSVQIELGFAYWRAGHAALAQRALERAWRADPTNLVLTQQLVYVAQRLKQNETARLYAERVLDMASGGTGPTTENSTQSAEQRFGFQRLHEDLGRRVTINFDGFSGTGFGTATTAPQAGRRYRSYSQLEADVRLGNPAIRDGSTLSAYARVFGDSGEQREALPLESSMLGLGLRWKPWRSQIIYFAAENLTGIEDRTRSDVLLRASASFFNGGRFGDDWHPARAGWISTNLYLDAAQYLKTDYSAATADYRTSYHRRLAAKLTLEPYGHVQFTAAKSLRIERDVRGGVGVRWNIWYGATTYDADPHKLSIGLEFQQTLETYLPDRNGIFVTLGTRW